MMVGTGRSILGGLPTSQRIMYDRLQFMGRVCHMETHTYLYILTPVPMDSFGYLISMRKLGRSTRKRLISRSLRVGLRLLTIITCLGFQRYVNKYLLMAGRRRGPES